MLLPKVYPASPGAATGKIVFFADEANKYKNSILVRIETSPEDLEGMNIAKGILTARGGMTSHAAVVARGMGKCCISGAGALKINYKTRTLKVGGHIQKIFFLVEETKKNGTLPFAGIARLAFITTKILYSIRDIKLLDENELQGIFNSVNSITKYINHDLKKLKKKKISKKLFFKKYGHIRPSTYSITSKNFIEGT